MPDGSRTFWPLVCNQDWKPSVPIDKNEAARRTPSRDRRSLFREGKNDYILPVHDHVRSGAAIPRCQRLFPRSM